VPHWLRSNKFSEEFRENLDNTVPSTEHLKNANVIDNRPSWIKSRNVLVETIGEHRQQKENQETAEPATAAAITIKSATTVEDITVETPAWVKSMDRLFREGEFV
jgi:hypothetical protein